MQKLYIRDNCHPAKIIALSLIHYGVLVSQTFAISNLCYMLPNQNISRLSLFHIFILWFFIIFNKFITQYYFYPADAEITQIELSCGGFGWISNLLENDSYLIIPLYLGILNYSIMEVLLLAFDTVLFAMLAEVKKCSYLFFQVRDLLIKKNESSMFIQALRKGIKVAFPIIFIVISANLPTVSFKK